MLTIHKTYVRDKNTVGLFNTGETVLGAPVIIEKKLRGYYRCFPSTARDVAFLRHIPREHKFAPANGGGILVAHKYIDSLNE